MRILRQVVKTVLIAVLPEIERCVAELRMKINQQRLALVVLGQQRPQSNGQRGYTCAAFSAEERQDLAVQDLLVNVLFPSTRPG